MLNSNTAVNKIAQILDISLKKGTANLKILLKGENEPMHVSLNYAFEGKILSVSNVKTDREWLSAMAELFKDRYSKIDLSKHGKLADIAGYLF